MKFIFIDDEKSFLLNIVAAAQLLSFEAQGICLPEKDTGLNKTEILEQIRGLVDKFGPDLVFIDQGMWPSGDEVAEAIAVPREKMVGTSTASDQKAYCKFRLRIRKDNSYLNYVSLLLFFLGEIGTNLPLPEPIVIQLS